MNALDTQLNYLTSKLDTLQREDKLLREKQVELGKEIQTFFQAMDCPLDAHPLHTIKFFRQKKVIETL